MDRRNTAFGLKGSLFEKIIYCKKHFSGINRFDLNVVLEIKFSAEIIEFRC